MLIIERKEGESIDRMLRRYKRKHKQTQLRKEVRKNQEFTKPSDKRRLALSKAIYSNKLMQEWSE